MKKLLILFLFHNFFSLGMTSYLKKNEQKQYFKTFLLITSKQFSQKTLNKSLTVISQPKTLNIAYITPEELDSFYSNNTFTPNPDDKAYQWFLGNIGKSTPEIEKSYRKATLDYHPDKGATNEDFQKFTEYKNYLLIFNALQNSTISTQKWAAYFTSKEIDLVKKIVCSTIRNSLPYSIALHSAYRAGFIIGSSRESKLAQKFKKKIQKSGHQIIQNQINYLTTICNTPEQKKQLQEIITDYKRFMV